MNRFQIKKPFDGFQSFGLFDCFFFTKIAVFLLRVGETAITSKLVQNFWGNQTRDTNLQAKNLKNHLEVYTNFPSKLTEGGK